MTTSRAARIAAGGRSPAYASVPSSPTAASAARPSADPSTTTSGCGGLDPDEAGRAGTVPGAHLRQCARLAERPGSPRAVGRAAPGGVRRRRAGRARRRPPPRGRRRCGCGRRRRRRSPCAPRAGRATDRAVPAARGAAGRARRPSTGGRRRAGRRTRPRCGPRLAVPRAPAGSGRPSRPSRSSRTAARAGRPRARRPAVASTCAAASCQAAGTRSHSNWSSSPRPRTSGQQASTARASTAVVIQVRRAAASPTSIATPSATSGPALYVVRRNCTASDVVVREVQRPAERRAFGETGAHRDQPDQDEAERERRVGVHAGAGEARERERGHEQAGDDDRQREQQHAAAAEVRPQLTAVADAQVGDPVAHQPQRLRQARRAPDRPGLLGEAQEVHAVSRLDEQRHDPPRGHERGRHRRPPAEREDRPPPHRADPALVQRRAATARAGPTPSRPRSPRPRTPSRSARTPPATTKGTVPSASAEISCWRTTSGDCP